MESWAWSIKSIMENWCWSKSRVTWQAPQPISRAVSFFIDFKPAMKPRIYSINGRFMSFILSFSSTSAETLVYNY